MSADHVRGPHVWLAYRYAEFAISNTGKLLAELAFLKKALKLTPYKQTNFRQIKKSFPAQKSMQAYDL